MSYQALLFCPDEKAARLVTQVLNELEFSVEPCTEPFAAVKKLMAEHYDAVVVDCENEQNATLLFKSARNSGSNQSSLAVAVVEGQAGVAKAFRIGANLVLTKPINVEQSKGTLRVARGLLRKADNAKSTGAVATSVPSQEKVVPPAPVSSAPRTPALVVTPAVASHLPPTTSKPAFSAPIVPQASIQSTIAAAAASASTFEVEPDATPDPEPAEAALLESLPELSTKRPGGTNSALSKEYPWQPVSKPLAEPMASSLRRAAEAAGKLQENVLPENNQAPTSIPTMPRRSQVATSLRNGSAAAPAPAKEISKPPSDLVETKSATAGLATSREKPATEPIVAVAQGLDTQRNTEALLTFGQATEASQSGGSKRILLIAAVLLIAAAGGYFGWTKMHSPAESTAVQTVSQPPSPVQNAAASPAPTSSAPMSTVNSAPQAETLAPTSEDASITESQKTSSEKSQIQTNAAPSDESDSTPEPTKAEDVPARSSSHSRAGALTAPAAKKPVTVTPESPSNAEAVLPPSQQDLNVASNAGDKALAGIVGASANHVALPSASGTLKVSQGVTQGLLIKKVSPAYPQQALQMRIQGSVQLQASISKEGQISNVKTLSGDAILARAAVDAVKQWKYKPYTLNGEPVGIQTEITVVFKLPTR